jgi:ferrous iron transport protein A
MKTLPLTSLRAGEKGVVFEIIGGAGLINRLCALGIIYGKEITKMSAMMMRGPIIICVGNTQIALGYGMANKIIVRKD